MVDGSAVGAGHGSVNEYCPFDLTLRAFTCVVVGEVLSCSYGAGR